MADNQDEKSEYNLQGAEEKKEKKKQPTSLESAINESGDVVKAAANTLAGTGAVAGAIALFGLDGLVTALSFPIGGMIEKRAMAEKDESKKQFTSRHFRDESIVGALLTPALWYGVNAMRGIPKAFGLDGLINVLGYSIPASALAVGGLTFASIPLFNAAYYPLKYLIDNKTFRGMGKDFKQHYWEGTKRSLYLGIPWSAAVAASVAAPALYPLLFPALAAFEVLYRIVLSKEKLDYAKLLNPFAYLPKFANPFYTAGGLASAIGKNYAEVNKAAYNLGSFVRSIFKKAPASPQPKPA